MRLLDLALAAGATLRLTRFVTSDWLGEWWLVAPARRWANQHDNPLPATAQIAPELSRAQADALWAESQTPEPANGWRSKAVKGLDCPFCVGFWIGGLVLLAAVILPRVPVLGGLWRFGAGALALNYVVAHVSSRIDG